MKIDNSTQKNSFLKNNFIFFTGSMIVAVLNYLYYPVISRLLSIESYGEVQVIITIVLQTTILLNAFGYIVINILANKNEDNKSLQRIKNVELAAFLLVFFLSILLLVASPFVNDYLKFETILPLGAIILITLLNVPFAIRYSWLQANEAFGTLSIAGALSAITKLIFAVIFIALGFATMGAVIGLIIATLVALIYIEKKAKTGIKILAYLKRSNIQKIRRNKELRKDLYYGAFIFVLLISSTILYSADVIFVRSYFNEIESGLYSGVATIGRIIFFATMSVAGVLLASLKIGNNENIKILFRSFLIMLALGFVALITMTLFPKEIITLLLGANYAVFSDYLPKVALFILIASLNNLLFYYGIALRKKIIGLTALIGVVSTIVINSIYHGSISQVVDNFLYINLTILFVTLIQILKEKK